MIYVVDKCRDNTLDILKEIARQKTNTRIIGLLRRFGHQMSLVARLDACIGDAVIMMDCDLEHLSAFMPELLHQFEEGYDVVNTI